MVKIEKTQAVELFAALGVTTASKWNMKRLAAKLGRINDMVDDETSLDGDVSDTLTAVLEAIEAEEEIQVISADKAEEEAPPEKAPKTEKAKKEKAPKAKKEKAPKTEKIKKEKTPKAPSRGVRESNTRPFIAGRIIAARGLDVGVNDEMVAELDETYGRTNPRESMFVLRNAWHAIRGFQAE